MLRATGGYGSGEVTPYPGEPGHHGNADTQPETGWPHRRPAAVRLPKSASHRDHAGAGAGHRHSGTGYDHGGRTVVATPAPAPPEDRAAVLAARRVGDDQAEQDLAYPSAQSRPRRLPAQMAPASCGASSTTWPRRCRRPTGSGPDRSPWPQRHPVPGDPIHPLTGHAEGNGMPAVDDRGRAGTGTGRHRPGRRRAAKTHHDAARSAAVELDRNPGFNPRRGPRHASASGGVGIRGALEER